jgi:anionic cell wall polymer biosynthesis LytR-Cps2A-Psr (LCP) family protein
VSSDPYRVLILGTDEVEGSNRPTVLTDTIMVVSYRPEDNIVRLLSLPRDLYLPDYQSKVNALYREDPSLPEQAVESLLDLPIDSVVVVRLADIASFIDLIGGITIDVPQAFEDELFPRDGVDVTVERDPAILYEPISFQAGEQKMDGTTAIKYARTRKSTDPAEGGDQARIRRQQQVISAIMERVRSEEVLTNPYTLGLMYRWYADRFAADVPLPLGGFLLSWLEHYAQFPEITSITLSATDLPTPPTPDVLLVHPELTRSPGGQWIYLLADPTGQDLRQFVQNQKL